MIAIRIKIILHQFHRSSMFVGAARQRCICRKSFPKTLIKPTTTLRSVMKTSSLARNLQFLKTNKEKYFCWKLQNNCSAPYHLGKHISHNNITNMLNKPSAPNQIHDLFATASTPLCQLSGSKIFVKRKYLTLNQKIFVSISDKVQLYLNTLHIIG